jgi:hypothetical protein
MKLHHHSITVFIICQYLFTTTNQSDVDETCEKDSDGNCKVEKNEEKEKYKCEFTLALKSIIIVLN